MLAGRYYPIPVYPTPSLSVLLNLLQPVGRTHLVDTARLVSLAFVLGRNIELCIQRAYRFSSAAYLHADEGVCQQDHSECRLASCSGKGV